MGEAEGDVLGVVIGSHSPSGTVVSRYEPLRAVPGTDPPDASRVRESVLQLIEKCASEATLETGRPVGLFRTQRRSRIRHRIRSQADSPLFPLPRLTRKLLPGDPEFPRAAPVLRRLSHRGDGSAGRHAPCFGFPLRRIPAAKGLSDGCFRFVGDDTRLASAPANAEGDAAARAAAEPNTRPHGPVVAFRGLVKTRCWSVACSFSRSWSAEQPGNG